MDFVTGTEVFPRSLIENLSHDRCCALLELLHYARKAVNNDDVASVLTRTQSTLGLGPGLCGVARVSPEGQFVGFVNVVNLNYSDAWLDRYWVRKYPAVDPVLQAVLQQDGTYHWRELFAQVDLSNPLVKEFLEGAASVGLGDGVTVSRFSSDRQLVAFISFGFQSGVQVQELITVLSTFGDAMCPVLLGCSEMASLTIQERIDRLTLRDLQVLTWMRAGKSNGDIATILGVGERGVRFHVEQILTKLDVASRTQAVAIAERHQVMSVYAQK